MALENLPLENILEVGISQFYLNVANGIPRDVAKNLLHKWLDDLFAYQEVPLNRIAHARNRFVAFLAPFEE